MPTITITLPESFTFTKRNGATVTQPVADIHESVLAALFQYGWKQKVNDAASGHPEKPEAQKAMESAITSLSEGTWAMRTGSTPSDPLEPFFAEVAAEWIKANPAHDIAKAYAAIDSKEQKARREFRVKVGAGVKALADEAKKRAKAAESLAAIDVDDFEI